MIYVVRHGQTDWNLERRMQGRQDIELNETGIKQAMEVREKLKNVNFDIVFSSPLKRALKTAQIITDKYVVIDDRLIERSNGLLEGKLLSECGDLLNLSNENDIGYKIEPISTLQNRVNEFLNFVREKYKNKDVLIVTHAGVSVNIRCYFEIDARNKSYKDLSIRNCQVLTYEN